MGHFSTGTYRQALPVSEEPAPLGFGLAPKSLRAEKKRRKRKDRDFFEPLLEPGGSQKVPVRSLEMFQDKSVSVVIVLLMADDAAHKCSGSCASKGSPANGSAGNGCYAGAAKAADDRTACHALGGIAHVGAP